MDLQEMLDRAGTGTLHVEEGWGQGRATYGGLVAGLALAALRAQLPDAPPLRHLMVSFVAPLAPGSARAEVTTLRRGKNATQAQAHVVQDGQVVAAVLAAFGRERASTISVPHESGAMPTLPAPETIEPFPHVPGASPDFFQHVEMRLADGGFPYTGVDTSHLHGFMRFREAPPVFDERHFVSLADAWPPAVIQMLSQPAPGSSLTWSLEITDDVAAEPDTHWAYAVRTDRAEGGYAHTDARIWHPDGRLVAISRQTVAVFG